MSDSNVPLPSTAEASSSSSVSLIVSVAIIGSAFLIGSLVSIYRCFKSCRSQDTPDRQLPWTVGTRHSHDPVLSAQIVYMHDPVSPRHRNESSTMTHHVIVVDDSVTVSGMSWAQRMMSGHAVEKSQGSVHESMQVQEAVYVEQPDGKHILAVSHRFKDSMIQVKPEDLGIRPAGQVSTLERSSSVGACMSTTQRNRGITTLFGTRSIHRLDNEDLNIGKRQKRKKRKGRIVKYDAWCQANLDMRNFKNYTF